MLNDAAQSSLSLHWVQHTGVLLVHYTTQLCRSPAYLSWQWSSSRGTNGGTPILSGWSWGWQGGPDLPKVSLCLCRRAVRALSVRGDRGDTEAFHSKPDPPVEPVNTPSAGPDPGLRSGWAPVTKPGILQLLLQPERAHRELWAPEHTVDTLWTHWERITWTKIEADFYPCDRLLYEITASVCPCHHGKYEPGCNLRSLHHIKCQLSMSTHFQTISTIKLWLLYSSLSIITEKSQKQVP